MIGEVPRESQEYKDPKEVAGSLEKLDGERKEKPVEKIDYREAGSRLPEHWHSVRGERVDRVTGLVLEKPALSDKILSDNTDACVKNALDRIEIGNVTNEDLKQALDHLHKQSLDHTRGRLAEYLANDQIIKELKEFYPPGTEAFLSGEFRTVDGKLAFDRFLAHKGQDGALVIDSVVEVKSNLTDENKLSDQETQQLFRVDRDGEMLIDGQRVQARLAPTVRMITVGPSDSVAELKLPVSSKELQQGVENAIHLELHEHFSDDQLKQLYSECEKRGLIGHSSVDFRRMLVPHDAPEFPHRHDRR